MNLKNKIKKQLTIGTWITIDHTVIYQSISEYPFDWVLIDLEHSAIDFSGLHQAISFFKKTNIACLVRPPIVDKIYIKRIMDFGADGIIIPNIKSVEDIKNAQSFMKYPPDGERGAGLFSAQRFGNDFERYYKESNSDTVLIAQVENQHALNNISDIVHSRLIDGIMVGPYDLTSSMGIAGKFDDNNYLNELEKIKVVASKNDIPLGIHVVDPDPHALKKAIDDGFKFIGYGLDFKFITSHLNKLQELKKWNNEYLYLAEQVF